MMTTKQQALAIAEKYCNLFTDCDNQRKTPWGSVAKCFKPNVIGSNNYETVSTIIRQLECSENYAYEIVFEACEQLINDLDNTSDDCDKHDLENLDQQAHYFADSVLYIYSSDLLAWLGDGLHNMHEVDEAMTDSTAITVVEACQMAQYRLAEEAYLWLLEEITKQL